jgi:hypothetical protein
MAATTPKDAVAVGSAAEQISVTARDPAKVKHLASHISLNKLE